MSPAAATIIQTDDGRFQVGLADDAPGPFESRPFAEAVASNSHEPRFLDPQTSNAPDRPNRRRWKLLAVTVREQSNYDRHQR
jgi:hypothetical protein